MMRTVRTLLLLAMAGTALTACGARRELLLLLHLHLLIPSLELCKPREQIATLPSRASDSCCGGRRLAILPGK